MRIALFLEDAGQLAFIRTLVERIAGDVGAIPVIETRNAVGGKGTALRTFRQYVGDLAAGRDGFVEILVVSVDGNCRGAQVVSREILRIAQSANYAGIVVPAVPDPHIEVWYLADGHAVVGAIGSSGSQPPFPERKCEPDRYKQLLREVFLGEGIDPPAGGTEYGEDIAKALDLGRACASQPALDRFCADLRAAVRQALLAA